jgi:hypothetical protein
VRDALARPAFKAFEIQTKERWDMNSKQNRDLRMQWNKKGIFACALAAGIACGGWLLAPANTPAADGEGEQAVMQADHALADAIGKADKSAAGKLLDSDFAWTDGDGQTLDKAKTLENLSALATDSQGETDIKTIHYSQLEIVAGTRHNDRFVRIWVKRPAGWRAFVDMDTPIPPEARGGGEGIGGQGRDGECVNPCKTVPYTPKTENEKACLAEWQLTKVDEWKALGDDWGNHVADEFEIINNGSIRNKPERVAIALKAEKTGARSPGAPILSMNMYDFGDTVMMISKHVPYQGGKPYSNVRVFVHRDNHWLISWSQQTTIQAAAPLPGAAGMK